MPIDWRTRWAFLFGLAVFAALLTPVIPDGRSFTPVYAAPANQDIFYPYARLSPLDIREFPHVTTYLEVFNPNGSFATGLSANDINLIENEQTLPVAEMVELTPGVQFVLGITFGPSMGIRDGLGLSRYDYLLDYISAWSWPTNLDNPDDLSLIIDRGPETVHQDNPAIFARTLTNFEPDPRQAAPSVQTLSRAIEVALDPVERPGMHRVVLFITPQLDAESIAGLQSVAAQASQAGVWVFIWHIAALDSLDTPVVQQMQSLANETGGQFVNYSGVELLPNIETYLEPLRHTYQLTYTSKAASSGVHTVSASVNSSELQLESLPRSFEINIQSPNPVFMALPSQIERRAVQVEKTAQSDETDASSQILEPEAIDLEVLVEFPDGHKRPLVESALVVDGDVVWRNKIPPFNIFTWDLDEYTRDGQHSVQALITDTLGLQGASTALPVEITVTGISIPLNERFSGRGIWVGGAAVLIVAAVIGLVLILGGRIRPYSAYRRIFAKAGPVLGRRRNPSAATNEPANNAFTPLQSGSATPSGIPAWFNRFTRRGSRSNAKPLAYLVPVAEGDAPYQESPVALHDGEISLGQDPRQVTRAIPDPALEAVHARLRCEEGHFRLLDAGTTSGTWVNYVQVPESGILLRHGDLVHIGRTMFRFTAKDSKDARKPVIIAVEQSRDKA